VSRIAHSGSADAAAMEPCIHSLFQVDAPSVTEVYGPPGAVANGARQIVAQLTGKPERNLELTRYAVAVLKLERVLARRPDMLARIARGIEEALPLRAEGPLLDPRLLTHFAALYSDTLSHLEPRIMVRGEPAVLRGEESQNRIRSLLLAAVRSARLWRQLGGSRWQILLGHRRLLDQARRYLDLAARPEGSARWPDRH
jgi:high frequency lysogenization protein